MSVFVSCLGVADPASSVDRGSTAGGLGASGGPVVPKEAFGLTAGLGGGARGPVPRTMPPLVGVPGTVACGGAFGGTTSAVNTSGIVDATIASNASVAFMLERPVDGSLSYRQFPGSHWFSPPPMTPELHHPIDSRLFSSF